MSPEDQEHIANSIACDALNECFAAIQAKVDPDNITDAGNWAYYYFEHRSEEFLNVLSVLCKYAEDHLIAAQAAKSEQKNNP